MTEYAICFDFPETPDPWFAGLTAGMFALVNHLDDAVRFTSETQAATELKSLQAFVCYASTARVVEVGT